MRNINRKICKIFSDNLKYYMDLNGMDRHTFAKELKFNYSTVSNWLSCYSYASDDKIEEIAEYFGIEKHKLTEYNGNQQELNSNFKKRNELFNLVSQLSDENIQVLITMAQQLIKNK